MKRRAFVCERVVEFAVASFFPRQNKWRKGKGSSGSFFFLEKVLRGKEGGKEKEESRERDNQERGRMSAADLHPGYPQ